MVYIVLESEEDIQTVRRFILKILKYRDLLATKVPNHTIDEAQEYLKSQIVTGAVVIIE